MFWASHIALLTLVASASTSPNTVAPNFRDLTIKVRTSDGIARTTTWYFKGARSRTEIRPELGGTDLAPFPEPLQVNILQCDQKTRYSLSPPWKKYRKVTWSDREASADQVSPLDTILKRVKRGPQVTVTVDSIDTGKRRRMGSYEAWHVKTTIAVEPSKHAATKASRNEINSWYIDLPGAACHDMNPPNPMSQLYAIVIDSMQNHDRVILKQRGMAMRGFLVEEVFTRNQKGNVTVQKLELLEFSEQPIESSLFELPSDYSVGTPGTNE